MKDENNKRTINKQENENSGLTENDALENLPPEVKKIVQLGFSVQRSFSPEPNPLFEKINEGHIDRILDMGAKDDEYAFKESQSNKIYNLIYLIIAAAALIFTVVFLAGKNDALLSEIFKFGAVFLGGLGGGYGWKSYLDRKKK